MTLVDVDLSDVEIYRRRAELSGKCLAIAMTPFADEGLPDLLFRASVENGYWSSSTVAKLAGLNASQGLTPFWTAHASVDLGRVADILATPYGAEDLLPGHYKIKCSSRDTIDFFGAEIRRSSLHSSTRRIAPTSLTSRPYQRAVWSLRILTFDPASKELLIDKCPACGSLLNFTNTRSIEICFSCYDKVGKISDLRGLRRCKVRVRDEEALNFFTSLVDSEGVREDLIPRELAPFGRGQIFELISSLAVSLQRRKDQLKSSKFISVPPEDLASASRAILEWPVGFRSFVSDLSISLSAEPSQLLSKMNPRSYFSPVLMKMLGIEAIEALAPGGVNKSLRVPEERLYEARSSASGSDVAPVSARTLTIAMRSSLASVDLSKRLGIALPLLIDLYNQRILPLTDPGLRAYFPASHYRDSDQFFGQIFLATDTACDSSYEVNVAEGVAAICASRANPWPRIFRRMLKGTLKFALHPDASRPLVKRLYCTNIKILKSALLHSEPSPHLANCPVTVSEASSILGNNQVSYTSFSMRRLSQNLPTLGSVWAYHDQFIGVGEMELRLRAHNTSILKTDVRRILRERQVSDCYVAKRIVFDRREAEGMFGRLMISRCCL